MPDIHSISVDAFLNSSKVRYSKAVQKPGCICLMVLGLSFFQMQLLEL
jgi:hypothetical protein